MKEMDIVEVIVEKEKYAKEGVHKGMQGWICDERKVNDTWLINFPRYAEKADVATISVKEYDLKQIPCMDARNNEEIEKKFGVVLNPMELWALRYRPLPGNERTVELDLTGCKDLKELQQRIKTAFDFSDEYDGSWYSFGIVLWKAADVERVIIKGKKSLDEGLKKEIEEMHKKLEENKKYWECWNDVFSYEILN